MTYFSSLVGRLKVQADELQSEDLNSLYYNLKPLLSLDFIPDEKLCSRLEAFMDYRVVDYDDNHQMCRTLFIDFINAFFACAIGDFESRVSLESNEIYFGGRRYQIVSGMGLEGGFSQVKYAFDVARPKQQIMYKIKAKTKNFFTPESYLMDKKYGSLLAVKLRHARKDEEIPGRFHRRNAGKMVAGYALGKWMVVEEIHRYAGINLAAYLSIFKNMEDATKLNFAEKIAHIVAMLHQQGYVHADIKPENILMDGNTLCFTDFDSLVSEENFNPINKYKWYTREYVSDTFLKKYIDGKREKRLPFSQLLANDCFALEKVIIGCDYEFINQDGEKSRMVRQGLIPEIKQQQFQSVLKTMFDRYRRDESGFSAMQLYKAILCIKEGVFDDVSVINQVGYDRSLAI
ncbi:MAG: protein kinase domain-containing protein [Francisellaceae bacterium]